MERALRPNNDVTVTDVERLMLTECKYVVFGNIRPLAGLQPDI